jgi:hypothetical protein
MDAHTKGQTMPDTLDVPADDGMGSTVRVTIHRKASDGWPWAVELEYRFPEDPDDEPSGDSVFLSLAALGEIGTFIKGRCDDWRQEREAGQ